MAARASNPGVGGGVEGADTTKVPVMLAWMAQWNGKLPACDAVNVTVALDAAGRSCEIPNAGSSNVCRTPSLFVNVRVTLSPTLTLTEVGLHWKFVALIVLATEAARPCGAIARHARITKATATMEVLKESPGARG